jgi:septum formation protein
MLVDCNVVIEKNTLRERKLVLASRSPRRKSLLGNLGFEPVVIPTDILEVREEGEPARDYTIRMSKGKAAEVIRLIGAQGEIPGDQGTLSEVSPWALSADTVVVLNGEVLEKPIDNADACHMLAKLSDRWHRVVTSFTVVAIEDVDRQVTQTVGSEVLFRALSEDEIVRYVATGEPADKAGSYGIQRLGAFLVKEIKGSYCSVVGLPVCEVVETLIALGALSRFPFSPVGETHGN